MVFSSYAFIFLFLPIVLLGNWQLRNQYKFRVVWLLAASYFFYAYWNPYYLGPLLVSTGINYLAGQRIATSRQIWQRRLWFYMSLLFNLGSLGFFKYYDFFASSINLAASDPLFPVLNVVLPLGISFYTFQTMSYSIDIFRGVTEPAPDLLNFALYIALFPQRIAGPIVRYAEINMQLMDTANRLTPERIDRGIYFFVVGLAKKVVIADRLTPLVTTGFSEPGDLRFWGSWLVALAYTYQLYFDFSGYCDMAVGVACLLGYDLPRNFDSPYTADSIADFWRRWHITLSNWLNVYVFLPLSRHLLRRHWWRLLAMIVAYLVTMSVSGLWHGAGWNFVVWGTYHGALLVIFQVWQHFRLPKWDPFLARTATFIAVVIGWVMFRAETFDIALKLYQNMLGLNGFESFSTVWGLQDMGIYLSLLLIAALVISNLQVDTWDLDGAKPAGFGLLLGMLFAFSIMLLETAAPFLYFQF